MHLLDTRVDIPERIWYADTSFRLGDVNVLDAYSRVSEQISKQADFQTYYKIQDFMLYNEIPRGGHEFWALSKYLDAQIQGQTYAKHPNKDWYITLDDDTFVFWKTFLRWLRNFDSNSQTWLGHFDNNRGTIFANGGGGYVVSGKMMRDTFGYDLDYANKEPELYLQYDAGDTRLGRAWTNHPNVTVMRPNAGDPS